MYPQQAKNQKPQKHYFTVANNKAAVLPLYLSVYVKI